MKRFLLMVALALMTTTAWAWPAKVVGVTDGDTITVLRPGNEQVKIRMYGIDAPESAQPHGKASKANLSALVFGKAVEIDPTDTDRYGRTVARVIVGGVDANAEQIKAGYAWLYRKYCSGAVCAEWAEFENHAQKSKAGLWADASPIAPWDWRHAGNSSSSSASAKISKDTPSTNGAYHGNVDSFIFHDSECRYYNCKNCVQSFSSRDAAIAAGYRPCKVCKP